MNCLNFRQTNFFGFQTLLLVMASAKIKCFYNLIPGYIPILGFARFTVNRSGDSVYISTLKI